MGADYAKRIVARVSGRPAIAAAPLIAPRGIVEAKVDDEADPFEAAASVEPDSTPTSPSPPSATLRRDGSAEDHARPPGTREAFAAPRAPSAPEAGTLRPVVSRITHEVTTRSLVEHERIVEQVVDRREALPAPADSHADGRPAIDPDSNRTPSMTQDRRPSRRDEDEPERRHPGDRDKSQPPARRSDDDAPAAIARRSPVASAEPPPPRQPAARRDAPAPLRPRPIPQPAHAPRPVRERSRLVIGRLVVEVVQPAPVAAPRLVTRPAASAPRPFRAGGSSSLTLGRPAGLGQG